jgi:TonB family protein
MERTGHPGPAAHSGLRDRRDGKLNEVSINRSSGNAYYDQVALRAINAAGPFPPFPDEFTEAVLKVKLQFTFSPEGDYSTACGG